MRLFTQFNPLWGLIGIILVTIERPSDALNTINSTKKELAQIKKTIQQNNQKLKPKKIEKKNAQKKLFVVKKELKFTKMELTKTKEKLKLIKNKKGQAEQKINQLSHNFQINKAHFAEQIQQVYKVNEGGMLALLFLPETMNEATESVVYFEQILYQDIKLMNQIQADLKQLNEEKSQLKKHTYNIKKLEQDILKQKQVLSQKKQQHHRYINQLSKQIRKIEQQNKELEEASKKVEDLIKKLAEKNTKYWGTGVMRRPASGWLSSRYGMRRHPIAKKWIRHNGIDIAARKRNSDLCCRFGESSVFRPKSTVSGLR